MERIKFTGYADIGLLKEMMVSHNSFNHYPALKFIEFKDAKIKFDDTQGRDSFINSPQLIACTSLTELEVHENNGDLSKFCKNNRFECNISIL